MKIFLLVAFIIASSLSYGQAKISLEDINKHVGNSVTVCSKVFGTKHFEKSGMTFMNLGAAYPSSPLSVVISGKDLPNFIIAPEKMYADKNICVTGVIKEFNGKLEIIVARPSNITGY